MRRSLFPFSIAFAVIAALLVGGSATTASAVTTTKGSDTSGVFYIDPADFGLGDTVKLSANFASSQSGKKITFFKGATEGGNFESIGSSITANSSGNAYLKNYNLSENQILFAKSSTGKETQLFTVGGASGGCSVAGTISYSPGFVTPGDHAAVLANFLTDQAGSPVTFYSVVGETETPIGAAIPADEFGNATLDFTAPDTAGTATKIRAKTSNDKCTPTTTITPQTIDPGNFGTPQGTLTVTPTDVRVGEDGNLLANFPSSLSSLSVTFFHEESPDTWESVGSAVSNSSGDATYSGFTFEDADTETFFALTSTGVASPERSVTPKAMTDIAGSTTPGGKNVLYVFTDNRKIPSTKGVDHPGVAAWSLNGGSTVSATFSLETLAVRGNTTAELAKKPFKLKFDDKQKPVGSAKSDKTWNLLANYNDHSFVRYWAAQDLGQKLKNGLPWSPTSVFTELYVNGSYRGSYQLIQSIKIDSNRVNINKETGQVVEFDPWWREDGVPGMEGVGAFARLDYAWKDPDEFKTLDPEDGGGPDPEGLTNAKITALKAKIRKFESVLYGANVATGTGKGTRRNWATYDPSGPSQDWVTYLDMASVVDYYIVKEFTKDTDSDMYRSNYFYDNNVTDPNGKFRMGPVWDFDRSAGARDSSTMPTLDSPTGWWLRGTTYHNTGQIHWYTQITDDPRFKDALEDRWNGPLEGTSMTVKEAVQAMSGGSAAGIAGTDAVSKGLAAMGGGDSLLGKAVAAKDRALWGNDSDRLDPRTNTYTNAPANDTTSTELGWLRDWYNKRYLWMDGQIN